MLGEDGGRRTINTNFAALCISYSSKQHGLRIGLCSQAWQLVSVITAFRRLRHEDDPMVLND